VALFKAGNPALDKETFVSFSALPQQADTMTLQLLSALTLGRHHHHRLMDFDSHPSACLEGLHAILKEALLRSMRRK